MKNVFLQRNITKYLIPRIRPMVSLNYDFSNGCVVVWNVMSSNYVDKGIESWWIENNYGISASNKIQERI